MHGFSRRLEGAFKCFQSVSWLSVCLHHVSKAHGAWNTKLVSDVDRVRSQKVAGQSHELM